jgi:hypothetical protein
VIIFANVTEKFLCRNFFSLVVDFISRKWPALAFPDAVARAMRGIWTIFAGRLFQEVPQQGVFWHLGFCSKNRFHKWRSLGLDIEAHSVLCSDIELSWEFRRIE